MSTLTDMVNSNCINRNQWQIDPDTMKAFLIALVAQVDTADAGKQNTIAAQASPSAAPTNAPTGLTVALGSNAGLDTIANNLNSVATKLNAVVAALKTQGLMT